MKETSDHLQQLKDIHSMMEKSSRFISLSGLSGVFAGIYAIIGAAAAFWFLDMNLSGRAYYAYFKHPEVFFY